MFFLLSKLLLIFILPLTWVLACLALALLIKRPKFKRRLLLTAVILLVIFSNPFLINRFADLWDVAPAPLHKAPYSCAIVLGGFAGEDAKGKGIFNTSSDRFIQGLKLLETKHVSHILISSGNGALLHDTFSEGEWVKTQLKIFNVPDSAVLIEGKSRNTLENAAFSKALLAKSNLQPPYVLVTSAFHMRRSLGIFKKNKIDVIPYPCNYLAGNDKFTSAELVPDAQVLWVWNFYIKEMVGTVVNYFK